MKNYFIDKHFAILLYEIENKIVPLFNIAHNNSKTIKKSADFCIKNS